MQLVTARSALASAIRIDEDGHNHLMSLKLYEFGIRSLFNVLRYDEFLSASVEPYSRDDRELIIHKLNAYIRRSLQIDKLILPNVQSQVAAQIRINDGDIGYDYDTLFRKYVTEDVTDLFITDYVNAPHQVRSAGMLPISLIICCDFFRFAIWNLSVRWHATAARRCALFLWSLRMKDSRM